MRGTIARRFRCRRRPEQPGPRSERPEQQPERPRSARPRRSRWHRCSRRSGNRRKPCHPRRRSQPSRHRSSSNRSRRHHPRRHSQPSRHRSSSSRSKREPSRHSSSSRSKPGRHRHSCRSRCQRPERPKQRRGNHGKPSWRGAWREGQHASCRGSWQQRPEREREPEQPRSPNHKPERLRQPQRRGSPSWRGAWRADRRPTSGHDNRGRQPHPNHRRRGRWRPARRASQPRNRGNASYLFSRKKKSDATRPESAVTNRFRSGTATGPQQRRCQSGWRQPARAESPSSEHPDNQRHCPVSAAGWRKIAV